VLRDQARGGRVGRIVADHDFDVRMRLRQARFDTADQQIRPVARGQTDRDAGCYRHGPTPTERAKQRGSHCERHRAGMTVRDQNPKEIENKSQGTPMRENADLKGFNAKSSDDLKVKSCCDANSRLADR
jgi:hypothetical protein